MSAHFSDLSYWQSKFFASAQKLGSKILYHFSFCMLFLISNIARSGEVMPEERVVVANDRSQSRSLRDELNGTSMRDIGSDGCQAGDLSTRVSQAVPRQAPPQRPRHSREVSPPPQSGFAAQPSQQAQLTQLPQPLQQSPPSTSASSLAWGSPWAQRDPVVATGRSRTPAGLPEPRNGHMESEAKTN